MKYRSREILFREAIIAFFVGDADESKKACSPEQKKRCKMEFGEFFEWACDACESNPLRKDDHA